MAEPQIKARLVLDTSSLDSIKGSSGIGGIGGGSSNDIEKKKESGYLKTMADAIGGPIKTAAQVTIKAAILAGTLGLGVGAYAGGKSLGEELGIGTTPAEAFDLLNSEDPGGRTGEEALQSVIDSLDAKAKNLEAAGDFEGAQEARDKMQEVAYYLSILKDRASEWDGTLEEAEEETKKAKGKMKNVVTAFETLIGATTGIWLDLDGSDDSVASQTKETKDKTNTWNLNLDTIGETTSLIADAYKNLLARIKTAKINKDVTFGNGRFDGAGAGGSWETDSTTTETNEDASGVNVEN